MLQASLNADIWDVIPAHFPNGINKNSEGHVGRMRDNYGVGGSALSRLDIAT